MKKLFWRSFLTGLFLFFNATPSSAISLGFSPSPQTVSVGDSFEVNVWISDLGDEIVSAFDLDVVYDQTMLSLQGVVFGISLGDPNFFEALTDVDLPSPGVINFAELSLVPDQDLAQLQPDTFSLATFLFTAVSVGTSTLEFTPDPIFGIDVKGLNATIIPLNVDKGTITVEPVPEPGTAGLLFLGLLGFVLKLNGRLLKNS